MQQADEENLINVREFLDSRLVFIREDYFARNKDVQTAIQIDMGLPELATQRLVDMCK